ncbi:MAG TPA: Hsp20/alpha crystallin family protein [Gemmatimonadales bacterium]
MKVANITKGSPRIANVKEDIDRMFDRFFARPFMSEPVMPLFPFEPMNEALAEWAPRLDLTETEKEFVVRCEVPGIHKENLDINLSGNLLRITGHRDAVQETKDEMYLYREREVGRFVRTLKLPVAVDEEHIEAAYQDGVLTIRVPKPAAAVAKKILIK